VVPSSDGNVTWLTASGGIPAVFPSCLPLSGTDDGENGQRVDVRLCRGWVDKWALGTMLDARERTVKLDAPPPDIGIAKILSDPEIRDRRTVAA